MRRPAAILPNELPLRQGTHLALRVVARGPTKVWYGSERAGVRVDKSLPHLPFQCQRYWTFNVKVTLWFNVVDPDVNVAVTTKL